MDYTFILQAIANLTTRLNQIVENARTILQLPAQTAIDSASMIHVARPTGGINFVSEKLSIQQIIDAILSFRQNQLVSIGTITVIGNDVTIPSGATWIINNIDYSNTGAIVINTPYAATGNTRTDIIVADTSNNMYRINGPETAGISPAPNVPLNTVLVTTLNVTDSTINYTTPTTGIEFPKIEFVADGVQTSFDLGTAKKAVSVFWNSVQLRDADWSQTGNLITLTFVPESGDIIKPI